MHQLLKKSKKYTSTFFLLGIIFYIAYINYIPGTYLTGWDNYQTDLNPSLGVARAFFSVWQEFQSFGLVAGMGHAADLVRAVIIWCMSLLLPQSILRYAFHILMLITGVMGMKQLLQSCNFHVRNKFLPSLGALFYLLNFGSIQILFLPFESFTVMYGVLPWAVWVFLRIIDPTHHINKKDIVLFFLINIAITPQGLSQQLFVVYLIVLGGLFMGQFLHARQADKIPLIKKGVLLLSFILIINSFWLLPQLYFLKTSGSVVTEAKANQLHTDNIFDQNYAHGDIWSFLTMQGFQYDLRHTYTGTYLFNEWKDHFNNPFVMVIVIFIAIMPLIGLLQRRQKFFWSFVITYIIIGIALMMRTFPFEQISELLRLNNFINQVFRSPFTKIIIPHSLVSTYFFICGIITIQNILNKLIHKNNNLKQFVTYFIYIFSIVFIFIFSLPAFQGQYFSPAMQVKIPDSYFNLIDYLNKQDKTKRIGFLPEYTFWGWYQNEWGYIGSGFLWYALQQPVVSRTFDVWSMESEKYFWEAKYAFESENFTLVENILEKYHMNYLILDHSITGYGSSRTPFQRYQIEKMLNKSNKITLIKNFDFISLYAYNNSNNTKNNISLVDTLPNSGPLAKTIQYDNLYELIGTYQTNNDAPWDVYAPFIDLTTQKRLSDSHWIISEDQNNIFITSDVTELNKKKLSGDKKFHLIQPQKAKIMSYYDEEKQTFIKKVIKTSIKIENNNLIVQFPKVLVKKISLSSSMAGNYNNIGIAHSYNDRRKANNTLIIEGKKGAQPYIDYKNNFIDQKYGYFVRTINHQIIGRRPFIQITDNTKDQIILQDRLIKDTQYYILYPKYMYGSGYKFTFFNYSYPALPILNSINDLSIYFYPFTLINNIYITPFTDINDIKKTTYKNNFIAHKLNYYSYHIMNSSSSKDNKTIILWQSYHPGWKAYRVEKSSPLGSWFIHAFPFLFGQEIKNHFPINNWANGWEITPPQSSPSQGGEEKGGYSIILIFWPQYLQYAGILMLILTIFIIPLIWLILFWKCTRHKKNQNFTPIFQKKGGLRCD